ncbi:spore coat protein GerQ [Fictibacillus enclensis]|uniref:spore coat protein GerQ n=1 Tax=Fictibacillus TaxID=1329200 RepID=UPI00081596A8|nr:spore germination protein Q [Fictibacillus enclensis]
MSNYRQTQGQQGQMGGGMPPYYGMPPSGQMGQQGQMPQGQQQGQSGGYSGPGMSMGMPPQGFGLGSAMGQAPTDIAAPGQLPLEQSYIENILRLNKGKVATIYQTFEGSDKWNSKVFRGTIEAAGRDHIILSDPQSGKRYLLLMVFVNYITFDEPIEYTYPFGGQSSQQQGQSQGQGQGQSQGMATYSPR